MQARRLIHPGLDDTLGDNVDGPSLIRVPDWVPDALGRYYLYFAHHQGRFIRLAVADELTGPYRIHRPGVLSLEDSGFPTAPLVLDDIVERGILDYVDRYGAERVLPYFPPHVASPDVHVLDDTRVIRMYYHGQLADGRQLTKVAESADGLHFTPRAGFLGQSYFRVFAHDGAWYALSHTGGMLHRSQDGLAFEAGPVIGDPAMRHSAVRRVGPMLLEVYYSRVGDAPEHIVVAPLDLNGDWHDWRFGPHRSVRRPVHDWEGADLEVKASIAGFARDELHELRDPGIFEEDGRSWLLYSVRGESGIGLCPL